MERPVKSIIFKAVPVSPREGSPVVSCNRNERTSTASASATRSEKHARTLVYIHPLSSPFQEARETQHEGGVRREGRRGARRGGYRFYHSHTRIQPHESQEERTVKGEWSTIIIIPLGSLIIFPFICILRSLLCQR